MRKLINRIKINRKLFQYLANKLYKFFNVIERNDLIIVPFDKRIHRVLDVYDTGNLDVLCDLDPSPIRTRISSDGVKLYSKFFKHYRSEKHDQGWRLFNFEGKIGFYNFKNKEVLIKDEKCK